VEAKERAIRGLAEARRRGDFDVARTFLAEDIVWHEPGEADYSGDTIGADEVIAMMRKLAGLTAGTFLFEPQAVLASEEHATALTRWSAERDGVRCEGNEIAVYRFVDDRIAEVWFWYDGYDRAAHDLVLSFET
jgi:uncharacterized protein